MKKLNKWPTLVWTCTFVDNTIICARPTKT